MREIAKQKFVASSLPQIRNKLAWQPGYKVGNTMKTLHCQTASGSKQKIVIFVEISLQGIISTRKKTFKAIFH